jgi:hypothetical protein
MLGEKKDRTADFVAEGDRLHKAYTAAKQALEKTIPQWKQRTLENAQNAATLAAFSNVLTHDTPDLMAKAYRADLKQQLASDIAAADGLIAPLAQEMERAKKELFALNAKLISAFISWASRVLPVLGATDKLRAEINEARKKLEGNYTASSSTVVGIIRRQVEEIEGRDIEAPIFRLPAV